MDDESFIPRALEAVKALKDQLGTNYVNALLLLKEETNAMIFVDNLAEDKERFKFLETLLSGNSGPAPAPDDLMTVYNDHWKLNTFLLLFFAFTVVTNGFVTSEGDSSECLHFDHRQMLFGFDSISGETKGGFITGLLGSLSEISARRPSMIFLAQFVTFVGFFCYSLFLWWWNLSILQSLQGIAVMMFFYFFGGEAILIVLVAVKVVGFYGWYQRWNKKLVDG